MADGTGESFQRQHGVFLLMRADYFTVQANEDGTLPHGPGAVFVSPKLITSHPDGHYAEGDRHWLTLTTGVLPGGITHSIRILFDDGSEMAEFLEDAGL